MIKLFSKTDYSDELFNIIKKILDEGIVSTTSSIVDEMESVLSDYYKTDVLLTNSGTSSLHLTAKLGNKGVLIPAFGFIAVLNAFLYEKLPIFLYDLNSDLQPDWNQIEEYIKEDKIDILIVVHQFGVVVDIPENIRAVCREKDVIIVEDASESIFSKGKKESGKIGDMSILSFNGNKVISAGGGGALVFNDIKYKDDIYKMVVPKYAKKDDIYTNITYNYRMTGVHAAFLKDQWNNKEKMIEEKKQVLSVYDKYKIDTPQYTINTVFWLYPVYTKNMSVTEKNLNSNGIEYKHFFKTYDLIQYAKVSYKDISNAKDIVNKGILLPIHNELAENDIELIVKSIE